MLLYKRITRKKHRRSGEKGVAGQAAITRGASTCWLLS